MTREVLMLVVSLVIVQSRLKRQEKLSFFLSFGSQRAQGKELVARTKMEKKTNWNNGKYGNSKQNRTTNQLTVKKNGSLNA